mgnify:CR=1 FL=1
MSMVTFVDHPDWLMLFEIFARATLYLGIGFGIIVHTSLTLIERYLD